MPHVVTMHMGSNDMESTKKNTKKNLKTGKNAKKTGGGGNKKTRFFPFDR